MSNLIDGYLPSRKIMQNGKNSRLAILERDRLVNGTEGDPHFSPPVAVPVQLFPH